ncbi:MAG TPA: hypothetical protein VFL80_12145 [Thermoanaerobaculia bacterium]|nr:hypothetical protein [Thermoanaerobaculia bacterium]
MLQWIADAADLALQVLGYYWPLLILLALIWKVRLPERWRSSAGSQWLEGLAQRPLASKAVIFSIAILFAAVPAFFQGPPLPWMHDDYANLLGGEMLASGSLSAPPHPLWRHFETMHQLMVPRYASKYPPGQALVLAAGVRVFREAIAGEWIVTAAACAAIGWAVGTWMTPLAGLLAGLAAAIHPTIFEWANSYRGGGLAALAGALLLGSTSRFTERPQVRYVLVASLAAVGLMVTRPFEGALLMMACALVVVRKVEGRALIRPLPVVVLILGAGLAAHALYNKAITGSPAEMPYALYKKQYDPMPIFIWQSPTPVPTHRNEELATMYRVYMSQYRRQASLRGYLSESRKKLDVLFRSLIGRPATPPLERLSPLFLLLFLPLGEVARTAVGRRVLLILGLCLVASFLITGWVLTLYLAPAAAAAATLVMLLLRAMQESERMATAAAVIVLLFVINSATSFVQSCRTPPSGMEPERQRITRELESSGGAHLILVPPSIFGATYNGPDIDRQPVVWARELPSNEQLLAYYRDRHVWRLSNNVRRLSVTRVR